MTFTEVSSTFRISDLLTPFALLWRKAHYKTLKREIALGGNNARKRNLVSEVFARKRKLISWKMSRKRTVKESATTDPPLRPLCSLRLKNETTHPLTQSQTHNYPFRSRTRTRVLNLQTTIWNRQRIIQGRGLRLLPCAANRRFRDSNGVSLPLIHVRRWIVRYAMERLHLPRETQRYAARNEM